MIKVYCIIALVLISLASFSQAVKDSSVVSTGTDTVKNIKPVFSRAEKMPKIIGGVKALEDTLLNHFSNSRPEAKTKNLFYKLIITKEGSVGACELVSKTKNKTFARQLETLLKQPLVMWEPALQNGRVVAAIKFINIDYENGNFYVRELE